MPFDRDLVFLAIGTDGIDIQRPIGGRQQLRPLAPAALGSGGGVSLEKDLGGAS